MIDPTASFKDNLQLLPSADTLKRIELCDAAGAIVDTIENQPGKQGSLVVYQYLAQTFGTIDAQAAAHGIDVFAEHTADAKNRQGGFFIGQPTEFAERLQAWRDAGRFEGLERR